MNDEEFECLKFVELKDRKGDQVILPICRIGSHQEIRFSPLNLKKFQNIEKKTGELCRTHWIIINDEELESPKFEELKYRREDQVIQRTCTIGSRQEIWSPLFNLRKFQKIEKSSGESCRTHSNLMNDEDFESLEFGKLKYRMGDRIIQPFCRIGCLQKIRSPFSNLRKFVKIGKSADELCRTHWNVMNDEEFESLKFVELKYRRGDQIIQPFCWIGSAQEIRSPNFNLKKFQKIDKSTGESFRTHWNLMNNEEFGFFTFLELKYRRGGPNNSAVQQNCFPPRN